MSPRSGRAGAPLGGLVFDLDGTLVDTLDEITSALNDALEPLGEATHERLEVRRWVGEGVERLVEQALPDADEDVRDEVRARVVERFVRNAGGVSAPYPGVSRLLEELQNRDVPLAVLSNRVHEAALLQVERAFGGIRFLEVKGVTEGVPRKPDPAGLLQVASRFGLPFESLAMVGDSPIDIATANAAGVVSIAVTWGFRDRGELLQGRPDRLVSSPREILEYVPAAGANKGAADTYLAV